MASPSPSEADAELESIGVYARVRPQRARHKSSADASEEIVVKRRFEQQKSVQVRNLEFSMDWIFDMDATQEEVYAIVGEPRVARVLQGYNCCLLAYGQTGSGKTYTMVRRRRSAPDWQKKNIVVHITRRRLPNMI